MSSGEILIYGVRPDHDFSLMPNKVIQKDDLSALATWLFAYINSKPPTYALCAKRIGLEKGISRYQALKLLRELRLKKRLIMRRLHSGRIEYRIFNGADEYDAYINSLSEEEMAGVLPVREKASYQEKKRTLAKNSHRAKSALISKTELKTKKQQHSCGSAYSEDQQEQACADALEHLKLLAKRQQENAEVDAAIEKAFDLSGLELTAEERHAFVEQYGRYATLTSLKKLISEKKPDSQEETEVMTTTPVETNKQEKTIEKQDVKLETCQKVAKKEVELIQEKKEVVVPADLSESVIKSYYMVGFKKVQVVRLYEQYGNEKMMQMFDLFKQNQTKVKSPKAWLTAALTQNFEVTPKQVNVGQIEAVSNLENQLLQERVEEKRKQEEQKQADNLAIQKFEQWRISSPETYERCVQLAFEDTMRSSPFNTIVRRQAKAKNISYMEAFLQSPFFMSAVEHQARLLAA